MPGINRGNGKGFNMAILSILTPEEIEYFKANKHEITKELLDTLREQGDKGKAIALEILDTPMNEQRYYVDSFGNPISFDGNKGLKKTGVQMKLAPIHTEEFERCANDFNYFRENYIRIMTPTGINFPEMRGYQQRLIDAMIADDNEEVVGLIGRQCVDGNTMVETENGDIKIRDIFEMN